MHAGNAQVNPNKINLTINNFRESLQPEGFVLHDPDWYFWGCSPILDDDGRVHLFVSRWPARYGFMGYRENCEIAHYVGDSPAGPFEYEYSLRGNGIKGSWRSHFMHNPLIKRVDEEWVLLFLSNTGLNDTLRPFPSNQLIGMATSKSLSGPWEFQGNDGLILEPPADSSFWCYNALNGTNNPAFIKTDDGRYLLYFKSMRHSSGQKGLEGFKRRVSMGVASSRRLKGPYFIHPEPITKNKVLIEDGYAFKLNDKICLLTTICEGEHRGGGQIFYSDDGINFSPNPELAFENITHYVKAWDDPSHEWSDWVLQMPKILLNENDIPTHLYCPCGTAPEGQKTTGVFMFSINPDNENQ
jgi:hypothetical protein